MNFVTGDWTSEHSNATDSLSDSDKIDDINLTTVCNNTYLTPACANKDSNSTPLLSNIGEDVQNLSPNKRKVNNRDRSDQFFRKVSDATNTQPKQSRGGNLIHPSENVALLKDSGRAKFVNLPDSVEDENVRVTLEC